MSRLNPKWHCLAFRELVSLLTRHRQLTWQMAKMEISDRYVGQVLGTAWALGHPILLMGIYIFAFGFIFKAKVGGTYELPLDYTTYLLSGLIPWMSFQEAMSKSTTIIIGNANLVKQVIFPIEILPVKGVLASLVTQVIASLLMVCYTLICNGWIPWTYILLPFLMMLQMLAMIGTCYILSSVSVYFRDIKDVVQVFCTANLYIAPIIYLPMWVPNGLSPVMYANPFSYLVWCYQDICYFGRFEHPWAWAVFVPGSLVIFYLGYRVFRKLKVMFGNVL